MNSGIFLTCLNVRRYSKIASRDPNVIKYMKRQLNDEYARYARMHDYRARSAFKLLEMQEKFRIVRPRDVVLDVGAAPGSWCQVLKQIIFPENVKIQESVFSSGYILGVDLQFIDPIEKVDFLSQSNITKLATQIEIRKRLEGRHFNAIFSDMAPNPTGDSQTDHKRLIDLNDSLLNLIIDSSPESGLPLIENGKFLCKIWDGGYRDEFIAKLRKHFHSVRIVKPAASRNESAEVYLYASGFHSLPFNEKK